MKSSQPGFQDNPEYSFGAPNQTKLVLDYVDGSNATNVTDRDRDIVESMALFDTPKTYFMAGSMALDIAARSDLEPKDQIDWLIYAKDLWHLGADFKTEGRPDTLANLNCEISLACLPSYEDLIFRQEISDKGIQMTMYQKLCDIAHRNNTLKRQLNYNHDSKEESSLRSVGLSAELAVLLLHQRFVINHLGPDSQMLALPARFSEDRSSNPKDETEKSNAWDVSIYTKYPADEKPKISYKVQVKSSTLATEIARPVCDDIIAISVYNDLKVTRSEAIRGRVLVSSIPRDCNDELSGNYSEFATKRLDQRTEKLLEILG